MINGFTVLNWKLNLFRHHPEDNYRFEGDRNEGTILAVADGVTRDPFEDLRGTNFLIKSLYTITTIPSKLQFLTHYPKPSFASAASSTFTEHFPETIEELAEQGVRGTSGINQAFREINDRIKRHNKAIFPAPDYLLNDLSGCTASAALIEDGYAHYGFISDCGVAIFKPNGDIKNLTENEGPDKHDEYIWKDERLQGNEWHQPNTRRLIRSKYRNNPNQDHAFGVLTGQETAMEYVRTGTWALDPQEILLTYSDGLEHSISSTDFSDLIRSGSYRNPRKMQRFFQKRVETEGTLVYSAPDL